MRKLTNVTDTNKAEHHLQTGEAILNDLTIPAIDESAAALAADRLDQLTKPRGALGQLENLAVRLVGMTGQLDWHPDRRAVVVCAADHGVVMRGVSAYPQAVTGQMVTNMLTGGAAVNVLARQMKARLTVVNAGVASKIDVPDGCKYSYVENPIAAGTKDFSMAQAMTREEAERSVSLGMRLAHEEADNGLDVLVVGEMGIGNTTSASAIIAAITGMPCEWVTGSGTGIDSTQLARKLGVIETALKLHAPASVDTLEKVGGFEIGAMAGLMLGAAARRIPVIVDGLICTAAALIAKQLDERVVDYLIAGHRSPEPGHQAALASVGIDPLLDLGLRLGEGTGAVLALPLVEASMLTLNGMSTFDDAGVSGPE